MKKKRPFWVTLVIFSLTGQIAWVVENMYFNVFIYKMFRASAADISLMVAASAVAATLTTILMGALSDRLGKRKIFMCAGYIAWGLSIISFAFVRLDLMPAFAGGTVQAAAAAVSLVVVLDCVMTFFGSTANDACYNAWLTDSTTAENRGAAEGVNSMMPLVAVLVVFGGFMGFDLDRADSWTAIYLIIGIFVLVIGVLGFFLVKEAKAPSPDRLGYCGTIAYAFRPSVIRENGKLYLAAGAYALFGIAIQVFMPYLIIYYEKSLKMSNYVLVLAPAILLAAAVTVLFGRLSDKLGFRKSILAALAALAAGFLILWLVPDVIHAEGGVLFAVVFIGSLFMMSGNLCGMAVFGAKLRNETPEGMAGRFQGLRILAQVLVPGVIGPVIGAAVLKGAETILNDDGTTSFLPNGKIFLAALAVLAVLLVLLGLRFAGEKRGKTA